MPKPDKSHVRIANEIAKKFGSVIDLKKSPSVIIEIIRTYRHLFGALEPAGTESSIAVAGPGTTGGVGGGGGTGSGGVSGGGGVGGGGGTGSGTSGPGTSSIAVAGPGQIGGGEIYVSNAAVMKAVLALHRDVKALTQKVATKKR